MRWQCASLDITVRVIERTEVRFEWKDLENLTFHPEPKRKRSSGVHVSQVIKHIAIKLGKLTEPDKDDEMPLIVLLGMAWEHYAARLYPNLKWQSGELKKEGLIGSPDGESIIDGQLLIEEWKLTFKSSRTRHDNITNEWMWMSQAQSYCHMKNTKLARLHVCWIANDYSRPLVPRYFRYLIQFTERDLTSNWSLLQRYKSQVEAE